MKYILIKNLMFRLMSGFLSLCLVFPALGAQPALSSESHTLLLPEPGQRVVRSEAYNPIQLRGISIDPVQPMKFDFIIESGSYTESATEIREEADKLIKYFLAALAVPEKDMWVNLSPYESTRIIPDGLGQTAMGRDMLAQDYLLKQLTASLIYPEEDLGQRFWNRVYRRAKSELGTQEVPLDTFNKVWIVPAEATVQVIDQTVYVKDCYLKVMLEEDYVAREYHFAETSGEERLGDGLAARVVREILIPEIEAEINTGKTFAPLRQIFHAVVLATWYKQNLQDTLLGQGYAGHNAVRGIDENDAVVNTAIYDQYMIAMQQGVFDYIREDVDPQTQQVMPRRYVSGGVDARVNVTTDQATLSSRRAFLGQMRDLFLVSTALVAGVPVPALAQEDGARLVAPGVQDRAQPLRWSDRSPMLGAEQPGIAYYSSPTNIYRYLLDEAEGGQGEAARIVAAGFKVIKVYTTDRSNILELERVSKRIYEQYGLRTIAVFSPQINGTLVSDNPRALWDAVEEYVRRLARHPWIGIQLGNEDHYYLRGELLAGGNGIPLTKAEYYHQYNQIASAIRAELRRVAPFAEAEKPILLGQGVRIAHRDDWRAILDETVGFIRRMDNINGIAVNAYLEPAQLYGPTIQYLRQQTGLPVVVGEFGRSRRHLTPALQQTYNQQAWQMIRENMSTGHAAGGILFSWSDKVPGDEAAGATDNFRLYDRAFGIRYQGGVGAPTYYEQRVVNPVAIPRAQFNTSDTLFWQATHNPRLNKDFLVWYTQQLQGRATEQQRAKTALIQKAESEGRLLTDDEVNHFHALNFMGEALYQLAVLALYDGNLDEVERIYDQMYVYFSGAQMHFGPRNFWVPFRNLKAQMELVRDTTTNASVAERLRLIVGARPMTGRPATYQDIRPDNAILVEQNPGGIDFHPGHMQLNTEGEVLQFPIPSGIPVVPIQSLTPVIINVTPAPNSLLLLGETKEGVQPKLSRISSNFFKSRAFRAAK